LIRIRIWLQPYRKHTQINSASAAAFARVGTGALARPGGAKLRSAFWAGSNAQFMVHNLPQKNSHFGAKSRENKELEFFWPPRSIVLKVVTGKILETWELLVVSGFRSSVLELRVEGGPGKGFAFASR
jgi:hypothetical protein